MVIVTIIASVCSIIILTAYLQERKQQKGKAQLPTKSISTKTLDISR